MMNLDLPIEISEIRLVSILCTHSQHLGSFKEIILMWDDDAENHYFLINGDPSSGLAERISCYTKLKCTYRTGQIDRTCAAYSIRAEDITFLKSDHKFSDIYEVYGVYSFDNNRHLTRLITLPATSAYSKWVIYDGPPSQFHEKYESKSAVTLDV